MKKILFFAFGVWISIVSFGQGQAVKDSLQAIVGDSIGNSLQQISSSLEDATKAEGDIIRCNDSLLSFKTFCNLFHGI